MKKVLIASAALFLAAITNVNAQTNPPAAEKKETIEKPQQLEAQTKTPVKPEALPVAIKVTTAGEDYKGWVVSAAFLVKGTTEYYELILTKEKETKSVKLNKDGKLVM